MRPVLVHYHLFKNAGSSIDRNLKRCFGDAWHAFDPASPSAVLTAEQLDQEIEAHPEACAFSSHCIVPPVLSTVAALHPIVVLREPISRVRSAWLFEWQKQKGAEKPIGSLAEYIETKFASPRRNAIENFQTIRLSVTDPATNRAAEGTGDEALLSAAVSFIDSLPAFGLVERFDESLELLQAAYGSAFESLDLQPVQVNRTDATPMSLEERHERIRSEVGQTVYDELKRRNELDSRLYEHAADVFSKLAADRATRRAA